MHGAVQAVLPPIVVFRSPRTGYATLKLVYRSLTVTVMENGAVDEVSVAIPTELGTYYLARYLICGARAV